MDAQGSPGQPAAPLQGVVVIEMATFVAGPSAGLTLAQLGADVVRVDPLSGAADYHRWPLAESGTSLYWTGLNRMKRSLALDLSGDAGREAVLDLICASGPGRGILLDNAIGRPWLSWEALRSRRADVIHVHIEGRRDGGAAVDYTVNAETGIPLITGVDESPVNHVLPAFDLLAGMTAATALLAALRRRDQTGRGGRVDIALADVALAATANLGWFSEAAGPVQRGPQGNDIYGSYGRDFVTADQRRVMVVALTPRQWSALVTVTGTSEPIRELERTHAVDLLHNESARYRLRAELAALFAPWFATRTLAETTAALDGAGALWAPYRSLREAATTMDGPLRRLQQPGVGSVISAESPMRWSDLPSPAVAAASAPGADTRTTLAELGGMTEAEIAGLAAAGTIAR